MFFHTKYKCINIIILPNKAMNFYDTLNYIFIIVYYDNQTYDNIH